MNYSQQLALLDYLEGRSIDTEPETFECCKCGEVVDNDGENSMLHSLCWMCFQNEYTEQTGFGNVYNFFSEFLLASSFTKGLAVKNENDYLAMLKNGINASFDETITIIKDSGKQ